MRTLSY